MNAVLRVTGEPSATAPSPSIAPLRPYGGREAALTMLREGLAFHAGKVVEYERLLEEIEHDQR